jgi:hypothetical protein
VAFAQRADTRTVDHRKVLFCISAATIIGLMAFS